MADDPDAQEWLDTGPRTPTPGWRRRQAWVGIGAVAVTALTTVLVVTSVRSISREDLGPTPLPVVSSPASSTVSRSVRSTTPPARPSAARVRQRAPGLFGDRALTVLGWDQQRIYALNNRSGRVSVTPATRASADSARGSLVPVRGGVILRPSDEPGGWFVADGGKPRRLAGVLATSNTILPGPNGQVWSIDYGRGLSQEMTLTLAHGDGTPSRPPLVLRVPGEVAGNGEGGLVFSDATGVYEVVASGLRRVSRGWLIAAGPRYYLVGDCDHGHTCRSYRIERRSGARKALKARYDTAGGLISPDGKYAALDTWPQEDGPAEMVVEVLTGKVLLRHNHTYDGSSLANRFSWLPDGRLLGIRDGRPFLFTPRTRVASTPDTGMTGLTQVAVRRK